MTFNLGNYDIQSFIEDNIKHQKGSSLSYRTILPSSIFDTPGPGEYEDKKKAIRIGKGTTVGKESKFFHTQQMQKESKLLPGPGEFTPSYDYTLPLGPSITFPKTKADDKAEDQPGPLRALC